MSSFRRFRPWWPYCLAAILALGVVGSWFVAVNAVMSVTVLRSVSHQRFDTIAITRDGEALIQSNTLDGSAPVAYRTLSGELVSAPDPQDTEYRATQLPLPGTGFRWHGGMPWGYRVAGFTDGSTPATYWYLIRDANGKGRAYFVGYDALSKQCVGYMGPAGFSASFPQADDQFEDPGMAPFGAYAARMATLGSVPDWRGSDVSGSEAVFLISDGKLLAVDLRKRSVRTIDLPAKPISVTWLHYRLSASPPGQSAAPEEYLAVRTADSILLLDEEAKLCRTVPLPEPLRGELVSLYNIPAPAPLVISHADRHNSRTTELYWIDSQGKVTRQADVQLAIQSLASDNKSLVSWFLATCVPCPVLQSYVFGFGLPRQYMSEEAGLDAASALARTLSEAWPPILFTLVLSALLAVLVYRRHWELERDGALLWALFILVTGPPGLVGYWFHRSWPPRERCRQCGAVVPRNRLTCLACTADFPAPAPQGIEIFA